MKKYTINELIAIDSELSHENIAFDAFSFELAEVLNNSNVNYIENYQERLFYSEEMKERWKAKVVLSKNLDNDEKYATKTLIHYFDGVPFMIELLYGRWGSNHHYRVFNYEILLKLREVFSDPKEEILDIISPDECITDFVHMNGRYE